jgi:hypothetical protein
MRQTINCSAVSVFEKISKASRSELLWRRAAVLPTDQNICSPGLQQIQKLGTNLSGLGVGDRRVTL